MAVNNLVQKIIDKRHEKLSAIIEKEKYLDELLTVLDIYEELKIQIVDPDGNPVEGKFLSLTAQNPEMVLKLNSLSSSECRRKIQTAKEKLAEAQKRFGRDSISIAVVGKARVGKSEFLKSVSNLSNYVIPAFSETDCTGAVSVIKNVPGVSLEASITFKSESEIIAVVQTYLDRIIPESDKRMVVRTLQQIRDLDMDEVNNRKIPGRADNNLVPYLEKFVYHYEEWAPCIAQKSIVLHDEKEVQTYVAQNNGRKANDGRINYYKYLAVNTCEISCTFDYQEAGKITLVDTVGFEDNAIGIENELVRVVSDQSDAVVFLLFPLDGAGGGVPAKISDIYNKIQNNCGNKNLDKWLFWLINHAPNHPKTPNPIEFCENALNTLSINSWSGEMRKIIDVSDQDQVREEFLIPLLDNLLENLDAIDDLYLHEVRGTLEDVRKEFYSFCSVAKKVMQSKLKQSASSYTEMARSIDEIFNKISSKLNYLSRKEKEKRDVSCDVLRNLVKAIFQKMKDGSLIPEKEDVLKKLESNSHPVTHYDFYCNKIRNDITSMFASVDTALEEMVVEVKNNVAHILADNDCGRLGRILSPINDSEKDLYKWLAEFKNTVLESEQFPVLAKAFENLYKFDFSVKGFLTYEVRACLDPLDPELKNPPHLVGDTDIEVAENIMFGLERNLLDVVDDMQDNLTELFKKPYRAFFAVIKEFSDQVIFAENAKYEWNQLYSENYAVVWAEEYKNMAVAAAAFAEWDEFMDKLNMYSRTSGTISAL